jgi:hypothetical protein
MKGRARCFDRILIRVEEIQKTQKNETFALFHVM